MPRLTNNLYLERHRFLRKAWTDFRPVSSVVPVTLQWEVHRYFQSQVDATDQELLATRGALTKRDPWLPNRAGKAFAHIYGAFCYAYELAAGDEMRFRAAIKSRALASAKAVRLVTTTSGTTRVISFRAVARPEPDVKKLSYALIQIVTGPGRRQKDEPLHSEPA